MARFSGKKILITGGASGIGLAAAKRIIDEGGRVMVTGRSEKNMAQARQVLPEKSAVFVTNDAADPAAATALAKPAADELGDLDGLFLNAGFGTFQPVEAVDADAFDSMTNANVRGPVLQMAALKPLLNDGAGVVATSSVAPYLGQGEGAVYASTKGALTALVRS